MKKKELELFGDALSSVITEAYGDVHNNLVDYYRFVMPAIQQPLWGEGGLGVRGGEGRGVGDRYLYL